MPKHKNVAVDVIDVKKAPDVVVTMSVDYSFDAWSMKKLSANQPGPLVAGADSSALAFALVECVKEKLIGNPVAQARSKVSSVRCGTSGKFVVCWNTKGAISSVRATSMMAASCLAPAKQYTRYSDNIKLFGGKPDKAAFGKAANDFAAALKKSLHVTVTGRMGKYTADHLSQVAEKVHSKIPEHAKLPQAKPTAHPAAAVDFPFFAAKGLTAYLASEYVAGNSGGMGVSMYNGKVYVLNKSWEAKRKQISDKKRIDTFVNQRYKKLGDQMAGILAYMVAAKCGGHADISAASKSSPSDVGKRIHGALS